MRRFFILSLVAVSCLAAKAQIARWIMHPNYNDIHMATGVPVIVTDSAKTISLWDFYGHRLASTTDLVHPFREGLAVVTKRGSDAITGFYRPDGEFVPLNGYDMAFSYPYFSSGYLLAKSNGDYCFIDKEGKRADFGNFVKMFPFSEGFANCFTFKSVERMKDPYYQYITTDKSPVAFALRNKTLDKEDVEFLSSLSAEGTGVVIIKRKLFLYDRSSRKLSPMFAAENETNIKKQIYVEGHIDEYLKETADSVVINAFSGKNEKVTLVFDRICRPKTFLLGKRTLRFKEREEVLPTFTSCLSADNGQGQVGIKFEGETLLPPQFEAVAFCVNDYAVVRKDGKWGMIAVDKENNFNLRMNKGNDIAFRHHNFETTVRLDMPSYIASKTCRFNIDPKYGCTIDKISFKSHDSENGNYVQYNCVLAIPDSMPDVVKEITYPVRIVYDGLKTPLIPFTVKAWHYKYINVELGEIESNVVNGNVAFAIKITADKAQGESDYPFDVTVDAGSLRSELEKSSETRYHCKLYSLAEGINTINVIVTEHGCPPSVFPFEIKYNSQTSKRGGGPVVIQRKGGASETDTPAVKDTGAAVEALSVQGTEAPSDSTSVTDADVME